MTSIEGGTESSFPRYKQATIEIITVQDGIVSRSAPGEATIQGLESAYG